MKIVKTKELDKKTSELMENMHKIADISSMQLLEQVVPILNQYMPLSGDQCLSALTTLHCDFSARIILMMYEMIADKDDTGYTIDDLKNNYIDGLNAMFSDIKIIKKPDQSNNKEEFKRL